MNTGLIERFRSLPMARSAVLAGRTLADAVRNVLVVVLMAAVGFAVGFRVHTNVFAFLGALALLVLFGYALSWVFAAVGLAVGNPETAQAAAFPIMAPLVFASSAFVPVETMPGWLQPFAENQPLSVVVSASRDLVLGGPDRHPCAPGPRVVRGDPGRGGAARGAPLPKSRLTLVSFDRASPASSRWRRLRSRRAG